MPTLPIITDVFRVTLNWKPFVGISAKNVVHLRVPSGSVALAGAAWDSACGSLTAGANPWEVLSTGMNSSSIDILPLDGSTPTTPFVMSSVMAGGASGDIIPAAAGIASLRTGTRGPQGRGRQYVGPVRENSQVDGLMVAGNQALMQAGWDQLLAALLAFSTPTELVVASYVHAVAHQVTSIKVEQPLATQRRRQDQLR